MIFGVGSSGNERLRIKSDGTVLMGGQTASYDGAFVNLELRKDSTTVGGSMTLVNDQSATAGATCQIDCYQNYRAAGKIVFGRENANNWQSSAAGADSFLAFHTNDSGTEAERVRISSNGLVGIGTDNPGAPLDVKRAKAGLLARFYDTGTNSGLLYNSGPIVGLSRTSNGSVSLDGLLFQVGIDNNLSASYNIDETVFCVANTGVGINTNNPLRKLHVEGEIISRSFVNGTGQRGNMIMSSINQGSYDTLGVRIGTIVETSGANGYGMEFYTQQSYLTGQTLKMTIAGTGTVTIPGTLSKGGGSFKIPHPLPELKDTKYLTHSFIEGPQCDNIYRGKINLVDGIASINVDTVSNMTDGTFVALNRDIQCFTSNETGWTAVKGSVSGNILTITAQDNTCTDTISWMVVGERQDPTIKELELTDDDGKLIVEPIKETIEVETEEVVVPADRFA
jgi:hypothetical protein